MKNGLAAGLAIAAGLLIGCAVTLLVWRSSMGGSDDGMIRTLLVLGAVMLLVGLWIKRQVGKRR